MKFIKFFTLFWGISLIIFSVAKGESNSDSIKVLFQDGVEVIVNDWTFSYKFGESDKPVKGFTFFSYTNMNSRDLLLDLGTKKNHGFTRKVKRKIPPEEIKTIKFSWDKTKIKNVTIHLIDGEVIKIKGRLKPECSFISKKKHVFGSGACPCIYLKGTGLLSGQTGNFEVLLNNSEYKEPSERFVEIRFASSKGK